MTYTSRRHGSRGPRSDQPDHSSQAIGPEGSPSGPIAFPPVALHASLGSSEPLRATLPTDSGSFPDPSPCRVPMPRRTRAPTHGHPGRRQGRADASNGVVDAPAGPLATRDPTRTTPTPIPRTEACGSLGNASGGSEPTPRCDRPKGFDFRCEASDLVFSIFKKLNIVELRDGLSGGHRSVQASPASRPLCVLCRVRPVHGGPCRVHRSRSRPPAARREAGRRGSEVSRFPPGGGPTSTGPVECRMGDDGRPQVAQSCGGPPID
jgi:hypothetical protein